MRAFEERSDVLLCKSRIGELRRHNIRTRRFVASLRSNFTTPSNAKHTLLCDSLRSSLVTHRRPKNDKKVNVILWGPTCDGLDKVWGGTFTASLEPGADWISFSGIGSSLGSATSFNGFEMAVTEVCVRGWETGGDGKK